jgi:uncharacterized protein (UPF0261 family)
MTRGTVYLAGTCDTKGAELAHVADLLRGHGLAVAVVDLSTSGRPAAGADFPARAVAAAHPDGADAVFTGDRGTAVTAMAAAFAAWLAGRGDVAGVLGLGGSGGTALVTPAMQRLPVGTPKLMVSTVASGNVAAYVGPTDIMMLYSVTDVAGLNRISRRILANAAHAMAGMVAAPGPAADESVPAIGLSMFGVTTPCVNEIVARIGGGFDCLVFHATGTGGQAMEKLLDSGLVAGLIDATTTEVADLLFGGVLPATPDRLGAVARTRRPYVGSCGALDMVNFGPRESVPERYRDRTFYIHNPQVTLMRTTPAENAEIGRWIAGRLNACDGEVRFFLPEGGVSLIDAPGQPFHDPEADAALFAALEATLVQTERRRLVRLPHNINDPAFAHAMADAFLELAARDPAG